MNTVEKARREGFCACCGYDTMQEGTVGTYDICPICFWEDDAVDYNNPERVSGPNHITLEEAIENFQEIGACDEDSLERTREPKESEKQHPEWPWNFD